MNESEYFCIQNELSKLLDSKKIYQKYPHSGYVEAYKKAVLDCKSKIHNFYKFGNIHDDSRVGDEMNVNL